MLHAALAAVLAASPAPGAAAAPADAVKRINQTIVSGEYAKGLQEAEALAREAERNGDVPLQVRALLLASDAMYYLNRQPESRPVMERALALARAAGHDEGVGRAYYSLSFLYERTEPERMVRLLESAQVHAAKSGDPGLQMMIHNGLGNALETLSRPAEALEHYRESTRFARALKQDHNLAVALANMGIIENQRARYAEARALMEEADAIHAAAGPTVMRGPNLANLGEVFRALGEPEKARALYERSLVVLEQFKYKRYQPGPLLALADLHAEQGERGPAEALRRRALAIAREVDDRKRIVWILCILAPEADAQGRPREADELLQQAVEQAAAHGDRGLRAETDRVRALMALRRGDAAGALAAADAALVRLRAIGDPQEIGVGENLRARALAALGRREEAAAAARQAIDRHARIANARYLHLWHGELARLYAAMSRDDLAREQYERSLARTEDLDRLVAVDRYRLNLFREIADVFRGYALWLAARGEVRRAWEVLEQGRARELRLRLVQGGAEAATPAETDALARLSHLQRRMREEELSRDDRQHLLASAAAAEAEYERTRQQAQAGGRRAETEPAALPPLPPDAVVVEYAVADGRLLVLSHRRGALSARIVAEGALAEDVRSLRAASADPSAPPAASARSLYDALVGPELADAPDGRLLVVPDGVLHLLPFAVLVAPDGTFLSERFVLSQAPSLDAWHALASRPPPVTERTLAVLANTRFSGGPESRPRLAAAAREARTVARRARKPLLLLEASEAAVAGVPFARFQAAHFASHVEIDEDHPERSRIVMAVGAGDDDGYLEAREIERMRLPLRLVVVSGCRSGQGRILDGEGVLGLSHALHGAGVRSLVTSLWDVTDEGAAEAMTRFYEALDGRTVGEALSEMQRSLRASSRFRHPAHWAAFFVSGDGDQRIDLGRRSAPAWLLALVLGLPAAAALALVLRPRRPEGPPAAV